MTPVFLALCICWMYALFDELSNTTISLIAIGNRNMADDGIGIVIVEAIQEQLSDDIDVQFWEDSDALSVSAELLGIHNPVVIVDCADMALESGDYKWFKQSECSLKQHLNLLSTHGLGFADALALAQVLGFKQDLYFFAIQPEKIDFAHGISEVLEKRKVAISHALFTQLEKVKQSCHQKT